MIECRYWMASPMLFMISEASEGAKKPSEAFTSKLKRTPLPGPLHPHPSSLSAKVCWDLKGALRGMGWTETPAGRGLHTPFCEGLVSPVLNPAEELPAIQAGREMCSVTRCGSPSRCHKLPQTLCCSARSCTSSAGNNPLPHPSPWAAASGAFQSLLLPEMSRAAAPCWQRRGRTWSPQQPTGTHLQ